MLILWTAKLTNNSSLEKANASRTSYTIIRTRHTLFFGTKIKREALENIVMTRQIRGMRGRVRPMEIVLNGLSR